MAKGHTKLETEAVLTQALRPYKHSDNPGIIYVSPELVTDIKYCKYGLGWDNSYKNCHRGIYPFAIPRMSLYRQQERKDYQDSLGKALEDKSGRH